MARTTDAETSGRLALGCGGCGEIALLLGRDQGWYEPDANGGPRGFPCGGCGARLILADRVLGTALRPSP